MARFNPLPARVGAFTVHHHRLLGHGTYGEVCVGEDNRDNTEVAVKRVISSQRLLPHIERELETLQTIRHPNIIRLLHHERVDQHTYFILELCDFDLQTFAQLKPEFESLKMRCIQDSTIAVKCLHEHDIIHRDLKPENILVKECNSSWIIKVSDFGLARRIPEGAGAGSFSASAGLGTLTYMAPEVLPTEGRARYSKPADVYSLGLIHLSIVQHTPGDVLLPKTVKGQSLGQWIKEEQRARGEDAVDMPTLTTDTDSGLVLAIKTLVARMIRSQPSTRCNIQAVYEEIQSIRQHGGFGLSHVEPTTEGTTASVPSIPPTDLHSAQPAPSQGPEVHADNFPRADFVAASQSTDARQIAQRSTTRPMTDLESVELGGYSVQLTQHDLLQGDVQAHKYDVTLRKLCRFSMPHKPPKGLINFGLGQQLDGLWLESQRPDDLHYSQYHDGDWREIWSKEMPVGQHWNCRKFVNSSDVLLQSLSNEVCFYHSDSLELAHRVRSSGWVVGLTDQDLAVVGNHASPVVVTQGVTLHLSHLDKLTRPVVELKTPSDKTYGMEDFLWGYGSHDGHVVVTNDKTYVDLYSPSGQHMTRVDLPGNSRRPSCTAKHVFVPVRKKPPTIQVLTWGGEVVRSLGAKDLGLRDNEWCWSISPVYDGKLNVLITDTDDQDYVITYKIEEH